MSERKERPSALDACPLCGRPMAASTDEDRRLQSKNPTVWGTVVLAGGEASTGFWMARPCGACGASLCGVECFAPSMDAMRMRWHAWP